MKFRYIGEKLDGERAFMEKTGIEWMPGSEHDVADAVVCGEMLRHRTVWERVDGQAVTLAAAKTPLVNSSGKVDDTDVDEELDRTAAAEKAAKAAEKTDDKPAEKGTEVNLDAMEAPQLHAMAKELGVKVHPNAGAVKVREAILASQKPAKAKK